ncbi:unnamed protein product [Urochloa humidicola]
MEVSSSAKPFLFHVIRFLGTSGALEFRDGGADHLCKRFLKACSTRPSVSMQHPIGDRDGNREFPVGGHSPIPVPVGIKIPHPRPREHLRGMICSHPHPRTGNYPRRDPRPRK